MNPTKPFAAATALLAAILIAFSLSAGFAQTPAPQGSVIHGRAYLFRGLIGLIDWGMDQLAARINRSGVAARIDSHLIWSTVANSAISDYKRDPKPIAVIGHSIGGDAALEFAQTLGAAHVPVSLVITYDPTRAAGTVPANVERYLNLYQSSNLLGGGDVEPGRGFHGNYASSNLKNRPEIIHVNLDKFEGIQAQLAGKVRSMAARGEPVPLHIVYPAAGPIELWDSGVAINAHAGDTVQAVAAAHRVPAWAVAQINQKPENATLTEGERIVVPRYVGAR